MSYKYFVVSAAGLICVLSMIYLYSDNHSHWQQLLPADTISTTLDLTDYSLSHEHPIKQISIASKMDGEFRDKYFENCEFSNCNFTFTDELEEMNKCDLIVLEFSSGLLSAATSHPRRPLLVFSHESPGYQHNRWRSTINKASGTMTYLFDANVHYSWGEKLPLTTDDKHTFHELKYIQNKTKGAYAYVSNCHSMHYNRLDMMRQLSQYIDVDIYGGCTNNIPCARGDTDCEVSLHSKYRFYLAFENSLCQDYITEKFWKSLNSSVHSVPVVIGGLSVDEYTRIAPPHSFIHAYNFSSIDQLGEYLRHLMDDDAAYISYHRWRYTYKIEMESIRAACDLCRLAHNPYSLNSTQQIHFADDWNNPKRCTVLEHAFASTACRLQSSTLHYSLPTLIILLLFYL